MSFFVIGIGHFRPLRAFGMGQAAGGVIGKPGKVPFLVFDEAGQLIKETNPMGDMRIYTYTALGKAESITDEAGRKTYYAYFPGGQVREVALFSL